MTRSFRLTWEKLGLLVVLILLFKGWFFGSFIDEQENIVGGWLISQGLVLYRDFFLHHTPWPYYFSSLFFLGGQPPWWLWRALTLSYLLGLGSLLWHTIDRRLRLSLLLTGGLLAVAAPKLNLQMFLADSIFALSFLSSAILLISYRWFQTPSFRFTLKWLLLSFFVSSWSTIVAVPPFLVLLIGLFFTELKHQRSWQIIWLESKKPLAWFLFSTAIFPLYFFLNGAWHDFWWSAVTYNQHYYFPIRLAETAAEQQGGTFYYAYTRLAELLTVQGSLIVQTAVTFLLTLKGLVMAIGTVSLAHLAQLVRIWLVTPVMTLASDAYTVLALGWWWLAGILIWQKKWRLMLLLLIGSGLLFIRNNEIFHLSVFFALLFWSISALWIDSLRHKFFGQAALLGFFLLVVVTHFSQSYVEQLRNHLPIVTQEQRQLAHFLSKQSQTGDRLQVTGGGLTYYLLADRLPASKTILYYSWFAPAGELRQNLLETLENQRASLVLLEEQAAIKNGTYFDPELVKALQTYYSEAEQGIYLPKNLNEIQN